MKNRITLIAVLMVITGGLTSRAADVFTFAGFSWNQTNTPNAATLIGNSVVLGGAPFSALLPNQSTVDPITFPQGIGFNSALTVGRLVGFSTTGVRALNLPRDNDGTAARHGVEVYWTNGLTAQNLRGTDFVIYESGSTSNAVEGVMVRARLAAGLDTWTDWYYFPPVAYQATTLPEVAFSYGFDLSQMNMAQGAAADRIQIANLMPGDRIVTTNAANLGGGIFVGQGRVVFDNSTSVLPDAGTFDTDRQFASGSYDPDPLYVAITHQCEAAQPNLLVTKTVSQIKLSWPSPTCFTLQTNSVLPGAWIDAEQTLTVTNGNNVATFPSNGSTLFFRLLKY
jgi:hypothetical protein